MATQPGGMDLQGLMQLLQGLQSPQVSATAGGMQQPQANSGRWIIQGTAGGNYHLPPGIAEKSQAYMQAKGIYPTENDAVFVNDATGEVSLNSPPPGQPSWNIDRGGNPVMVTDGAGNIQQGWKDVLSANQARNSNPFGPGVGGILGGLAAGSAFLPALAGAAGAAGAGAGGYGAAPGTLQAANAVGAAGGDALGSFIGGNTANWGLDAATAGAVGGGAGGLAAQAAPGAGAGSGAAAPAAGTGAGAAGAVGAGANALQALGPLSTLASGIGVAGGLHNLLNPVNPGANQNLTNAGNQTFAAAQDPQNALYNRTLQQVQDQSRQASSVRGIGMSPEAAGIENQATSNFNIDWQNNQLSRMIAALGGMSGANNASVGQANLGLNQSASGTNALLTGLNGLQANYNQPGSWLSNIFGGSTASAAQPSLYNSVAT
jgi:hypothetical protein